MNFSEIIYLDHNATTPLDEAVLAAMLPLLREQFGNPASGHVLGRAARAAVQRCRSSVASLLGARSGQIVFTASATEANNLAIAGLTAGFAPSCHVITTTIEHKSVAEPIRHLERTGGISVAWLQPDPLGQVHPDMLYAACTPDTRLVSIQAANSVIHTLNPIAELARVCLARGALFHCDATQWIGKLPINVDGLGIDALSLSAHKFYGPKGAGALYLGPKALRAGVTPQILGGGQEDGLRSGTLNVPAIVGLGAACQLAMERQEADAARTERLARTLLHALTSRLPGVTLNGHPQERLPGSLHLTLEGVDAKGLIASVPQVALSDGSACETDRDPDYVLKAIGRPEAAHHSIRCQIGRTTTTEEIDRAIELLVAGVARMRTFSGLG
ncbi:MAG: cysteine desulfurase family protein [Thermoguttaceae bacterium]